MLVFNVRIPIEIMLTVLQHCNLRDLAVASRVSRYWRRVIFSQLHREISLTRLSHPETLISRLELEESDAYGDLQIGLCLRSFALDLVVYSENDTWFKAGRDDMLANRFRSVIPKLARLEKLKWTGYRLCGAPDLCARFQGGCPNLRKVELSLFDIISGPNDIGGIYLPMS